MTEYLVRMLSPHLRLVTLSRGYGRKTKGFLEVQTDSDAETVGDEPLQFKKKFPHITVADCESRVDGLKLLMAGHDVFILDDAYQHRALKAGLTILLFDFNSLRGNKLLIPAGNYRDLYARRNFADMVVITKSPTDLNSSDRKVAMRELNVKEDIPVFFSFIKYGDLIHVIHDTVVALDKKGPFLIVTGIANPTPFIEYLASKGEILKSFIYPDHYQFSAEDVAKIKKHYVSLGSEVIIVTTEKDAMRLKDPNLTPLLTDLPIYYIPIEMVFHQETLGENFDDVIKKKILKRDYLLKE